jgi:murein L,D-transpeptidase YafK
MRLKKPSDTRLAALAIAAAIAFQPFAGAETVPGSPRARAAYTAQKPVLAEALVAQGLTLGSPVYLVITKQPAEVTAYVQHTDATFHRFRSWPVCAASGTLGPKTRQGDGQAPEGFYRVRPGAMNPASSYHLSFNLGYPNARDRALGYTGDFLMVHGACVSIGCYAMTDPVIEEIWTLMQAAFEGGQPGIDVHIYPFPMTAYNLQQHEIDPNSPFWRSLAPAWVHFETTGKVPEIRQTRGIYSVVGDQ